MEHLDPHQRPPDSIRNVYKKYQKKKWKELGQDEDIVDLTNPKSASSNNKVHVVNEYTAEELATTFRAFAGKDDDLEHVDLPTSILVYEHEDLPGLHLVPSLLPPSIQTLLLSRLLHRDLSNPVHLTNIHTHYTLSYPPSSSSFFSTPPASTVPVATPLSPTIHRPLTTSSLLSKRLRWITLGGQYDWTAKRYPNTQTPAFPSDIKGLLEDLFPRTEAAAAIVNLYSPGDTLSVHRDVAETSNTGLVSVSLGCDAIFVIGTSLREDMEEKSLTLRLGSGSAVYMSGSSRFAWHGVPQIVAGTCPDYLENWPGTTDGIGEYEEWKGWMAGKRVNLNVRQMWD
ncbi:hypothetical protein BDW02DRAFT_509420 [Decorospora gaudefroyi]|uniref:mRNA N(6)-methyladenine demethylase n=1 Tax=Decorospora gaudefroyi TaxID=184978 RepID=A0A6A5K4L3_9PLEO|nr:hypothetical protein BDW02DRAFT_509420 [Decorospora gaudefroyi]